MTNIESELRQLSRAVNKMALVLAMIPKKIGLGVPRFYCGHALCKGNMNIHVVSK